MILKLEIKGSAHGFPVATKGDPHGQMPEAEAVIVGATGTRCPRDGVWAMADASSFWVTEIRQSPAVGARAAQNEVQTGWKPEAQALLIATRVKAREAVAAR